jgi:hypothetical protein
MVSTPPPVPPPLLRFDLLTRVMTTQASPAGPARDADVAAADLDPAKRFGCCWEAAGVAGRAWGGALAGGGRSGCRWAAVAVVGCARVGETVTGGGSKL